MSQRDSQVAQSVFSIGDGEPFSSNLMTTEPEEVTSNYSIEDLVGTRSEDPDKTQKVGEPKETPTESKEEAKVEKQEEPKEPKKETKGTPAYLLAESYKKDGTLPEDVELKQDLTAKELKSLMKDAAKKEAVEEIRSEYEEKFNPETLKTADLINKGINPNEIREVAVYKKLSELELPDEYEDAIKTKKGLIEAMYKEKGLSDSKIKRLIDDAIEEDEGETEFVEAKEYFGAKGKALEDNLLKEAKSREEADFKTQDATNKEIKALIKSGKIYNTDKEEEQNKLIEALFTQSETIKTPDGKVFKVTPYQKKLQEYENDLEKQIIFAKLLMSDFDLKSIESKGAISKADELDELLESVVTTSAKEASKKEPNWMDNLIEL